MDMTRAVYERSLEWVKHFVAAGTQRELNLAGIGESTLHPDFVDFVRLARDAIGTGKLIFATNGVGYGEDLVAALAPYGPRVFVSLHRPEKAVHAVQWFTKHGLLDGVSVDPATNPNDWAGQVEWPTALLNHIPCQWMRVGRAMVMADGRITSCCLDASGVGVIGHVDDEIGSVVTRPYSLCATCYQDIAIEGYEQRPAKPALSLPLYGEATP
jgi:hypothetical protein